MPDIFDSYSHQRPDINPIIYAYSDTRWPGYLKVGYTTRSIEDRMKEHYPTLTPTISYKVRYVEPALYSDGTAFTDHEVHKVLKKKGFPVVRDEENGKTTEWFKCTVKDVRAAVLAVKTHTLNEENRTETFGMRPEQLDAVNKTEAYFKQAKKYDPTHTAKYLWNCKMRFGKTFTSYQLALRMGLKNILILTFKPAVEDSWETDLLNHVDFEGWQFYSRKTEQLTGKTPDDLDKTKPIVCFGSFQDYLGTNAAGGIKAKNEWVHTTNWDLVIFDEYHYGAWRDNAKKLFDSEDEDSYDSMDMEKYASDEAFNAYNESFLPITTQYYLFLSGTPFRAINNGEFLEDQIYSWTYSDEQREKDNWDPKRGLNPYAELPRMVMMTYKMPAELERVAKNSDNDEFDLNVFFSAKSDTGSNEDAHFVFADEVQKWLNMIRGSYMPMAIDDLKLSRGDRPVMPFSDRRMLNTLTHTLWFMPNVISCYAMRNLLAEKQNTFWHDYKVNLCAGAQAGVGLAAVEPVRTSMDPALETKTITLSCGKLTTGITIRPWTGILMLRNLSSPETYFQAAFRVQSPWTLTQEDGTKKIIKEDCYVFDFAVNRCLRQISDYSRKLNLNEPDEEKKVGDFIRFLPVLAFDGSVMAPIDAGQILDIVTAGTSATLLARKWQSSLLVNVDNETLDKILKNQELMAALENIEDFRNLREDISVIINKSEHVKKAKAETDNPTPSQKKELTEEEKLYKSKRKKIQESLKRIASRLPIFMYLTDYREHSIKDVITKLEPDLFYKATGLTVKTFEMMVSIGAFNESLMNDAVVQFRRYESASLEYTGITKHDPKEDVGLFSTVITREDYDELARQQQLSTNPVKAIVNSVVQPGSMTRSKAKTIIRESDTVKPKPEGAKSLSTQAPKPIEIPVIPAKQVAVEATPKKSKFSAKSIGVGTVVTHKAFGEGKVVRVAPDRVVVRFTVIGEKTFIMPTAFEKGFLKLG